MLTAARQRVIFDGMNLQILKASVDFQEAYGSVAHADSPLMLAGPCAPPLEIQLLRLHRSTSRTITRAVTG